MSKINWKCNRCGELVDYAKFRCGCTTSPSPWEVVQEGSEAYSQAKFIRNQRYYREGWAACYKSRDIPDFNLSSENIESISIWFGFTLRMV